MENGPEIMGAGLSGGFVLFMIILGLGLAVLDGIALWKAARHGSKGWFIALFITNTIILELLYIFVFSKEQDDGLVSHEPPQPPESNNPQPPMA